MSSKTTTSTTNQYNQTAMRNYDQFQGTLAPALQDYASNPLQSSFFNQQYAMANNQASEVGQRNISNILSNARTGGGIIGNSGAFMQNLTNNASMNNSALNANAFQSTLSDALRNRQWALSSMQGYQPLQTGQTTTQKQSMGLGSILGTVAGVGLNMAMPGLGSMLGGGTFAGGYRAATPSYGSFSSVVPSYTQSQIAGMRF